MSDEEKAKEYRLEVKKRLFLPYRVRLLSVNLNDIIGRCFLIYSEISLNLSLLLSNMNPLCTPLPFVSIMLQLSSAESKVAHVQHFFDQLTAPYCRCLLCYQKN